jgi:hypothetical protein
VRPRGPQRGQASVELVASLPLIALMAATVLHLLAAGAARVLADHAAEAGAVAILQERDPRAAARDALPGWTRRALSVRVDGRSVRVRLRPPAAHPAVAARLVATARADAGPRAP